MVAEDFKKLHILIESVSEDLRREVSESVGSVSASVEDLRREVSESVGSVSASVEELQREVSESVGSVSASVEELQREVYASRAALSFVVEDALDPWETIHSEVSENVRQSESMNLKPVSEFYEIPSSHYCMVLGRCTHSNIICAHIWPKRTHGKSLPALGLSQNDVNHPRNYLRLHEAIEKAFDRKRLTFLPVPPEDGTNTDISFELVILDPALRGEGFAANNTTISFADLDGQKIYHKFSIDKKPFCRLLAIHASKAFLRAKEMAWIADDGGLVEKRSRAYELARLSLSGPKDDSILRAFIMSPNDAHL